MSRLSKLTGKPKEVEIEGEKITLYPLKGKHLHMFAKKDVSEEQALKMSRDIIRSSWDPDESITDEELDNLPLKVMNKLLEEIMDLNGLKENEPGIGKIKEKIALRQQQKVGG